MPPYWSPRLEHWLTYAYPQQFNKSSTNVSGQSVQFCFKKFRGQSETKPTPFPWLTTKGSTTGSFSSTWQDISIATGYTEKSYVWEISELCTGNEGLFFFSHGQNMYHPFVKRYWLALSAQLCGRWEVMATLNVSLLDRQVCDASFSAFCLTWYQFIFFGSKMVH